MDRDRYLAAQTKERDARRGNPVTITVTGEDYEMWKFALMLLRRVAGNTKDGDLDRVESRLAPLLGRINDAFREVPEVKAAINEQRDLLDLPPID